jgi:protein-disulfide isomerase
MRITVVPALLFLAVAAAQTGPADWRAATALPNVDFTGLTAVQKRAALKALREESCICGCSMKIAQCRVEDPACGDSRTLAGVVVKAVREGKDVAQAIASSDLAKRRSATPDLLEAPIRINTAGSPSKGPHNARITIVEFSDFECTFCSRAAVKVNAILAAYPRDARLIYKHYPIPTHRHARLAAEASLAAQAQNKFWLMHDKLFANYNRLTEALILQIAKEVGLDLAQFQADMKSAKVKQAVDKDIADGQEVQIAGTPTFFINGKRYNGPLEMAVLKPLLDAELKGGK